MLSSVIFFEIGGANYEELRRAFETELGGSVETSQVRTEAALLEAITRDDGSLLVVLPHDAVTAADGGALLSRIRAASIHVPIVVTADQGDVRAAASAVERGATDFLVCSGQLRERVATLLGKLQGLFAVIEHNRRLDQQNAQLRESLGTRFRLLGHSPAMRQLLDRIQRVAAIPRPVLIMGERGTGKEMVARAIHFASAAAAQPLITVNCAALGDALLESELFGHERGAFTGAEATRFGKFEQADSGTLFLDEIAHMSLAFQQKILRVVEYGVFSRVGGSRELTTTARIIAATNCDLRQKIARGEFLADLYDRLAFEVLEVPPLRERPGDIEILARYFLEQFARETPTLRGKRLAPDAWAALTKYFFPGNVRELKNIIERAAYRDITGQITLADLGLQAALETGENGVSHASFEGQLAALSRRLLQNALQQAQGNQAAAARALGLTYHQFRYYLKKYR